MPPLEQDQAGDAIVWATAQQLGFLLVIRNTRDFPHDDPGVRMPYRL